LGVLRQSRMAARKDQTQALVRDSVGLVLGVGDDEVNRPNNLRLNLLRKQGLAAKTVNAVDNAAGIPARRWGTVEIRPVVEVPSLP